ncbi:MAG: diacylglycerol kinase family protein [Patescibacteria group bacterium]
MHKHTISFRHAWDGIVYAFSSQPNFRVHLVLSVLACLAAWWLNVAPTKWLVLILTIVMGLVVEMVNTAIEAVVDLITEEKRLNAKFAKDVAAGAMLIYAIGSLFVALWLFT